MAPLSSEAQTPQTMSQIEALKLAIRGKIIQETYGNWFGPGWWGGTRDTRGPGEKPPTDSMDEIAMAHDFGYQVAEEEGKKYGGFEEERLKSIADAIAAAQAKTLTWIHPPKKPALAEKNREIMIKTFETLSPLRQRYFEEAYNQEKKIQEMNLVPWRLAQWDAWHSDHYTKTKFLKEVQNKIDNWYATNDIEQILPVVYDPKTPQVGNLPDDEGLQQELIDMAIKYDDENDYLKLRQFGATQYEADSIVGWLKQRYVESEKSKAIKKINTISRRNETYMHYHVDVQIEGKTKVLSNRWVPLKAIVESKIDKKDYVTYSWSRDYESNEGTVFFLEKTPGKYTLSVSVIHLGVEVAKSEPFDIIVVDDSNPVIELQINGPSQANIGDDITLFTSKKAKNEAGELFMQGGGLYINWEFNDIIFDRGDAIRPVFSEPVLHKIKAYLMYDDNGEYITVSEATKEINVLKKENLDDRDVDEVPPEEKEDIKEDGREQETKDEDSDSTKNPEKPRESETTEESPPSSYQPLSFSGTAPSIWEGGNDDEGFYFTRKKATANYVDSKRDAKYSASVSGHILGKFNKSFAPDSKEALLIELNEKAKNSKSRFNNRTGMYEAKAEVRSIAIDDFSGYLLESEVNGGGGYWTNSSSANAGSIAWAEGWVFKGNKKVYIEYRISGGGPTNSSLNSFLLSHTKAGQSEAKGILAGLHLTNNGTFSSTPYNGPKLDGSDMLKASLTAFPESPSFLGQTVELTAKVSGGKPPYSYAWTGDYGGKGATVYFGSRKDGEHELSVTITDARGDNATADITINVEALDVIISQISPLDGDQIFPGSPVEFEAKIKGSKNNKLEILFQPHPEVSFEPFELFNNEKNITSATFPTIGTYKVWAQVYFRDGESPTLVGESDQITVDVSNPVINLIADNEAPFVGQKVTIEVKEPPISSDELIFFWWEIKGGKTINAGPEANIPHSRAYSFIPASKEQVTVTVHARAKNGGADLGEASLPIKAKEIQVVASKPKRLDKAPWIWDSKQGKAVEIPLAIAVFQNAEVHASLTPKPKEKVRYQWTVSPESCSIAAPMSQSTNLSAHETGTYQVTVKVSDKNGIFLGEGSTSYTVSVSQHDLDVAKQKEADHQQAQKLLEEGLKDWKEGKLEQAITKVSQALNLVGKDNEIAQNLNSMQNQKVEIDEKLATASDYIKQGMLDDAEKILSEAADINKKYEKYIAVNNQLTDARKKLAILLQDAITLQAAGNLNEAVEVLKKGRIQFPGNNEITDQLKVVQKHQEDAHMKMNEGQDQWEKGLLDEALSTLKEASKIDPSNEQIANSLKEMQDQKKMVDNALAEADILIEQKKLEDAKVLLDKVGSISSQYPSYVEVLKRYDDAITQVNRIKEILADAKAKWEQNESNGAIADLDEILKIDPTQAEAMALKKSWQDILEEIKSSESKPTLPIIEKVISASFDPPSSPNMWEPYRISLTADNFGVDDQTFRQVMANVNGFRIRTEMHNGNDVGGIDAVKIGNLYSSDFDDGADAWNAAGDGTMKWSPSEGITGGYIQISDWASGEWHWAVAPASWSGNWQSLIGSSIDFYYKTDHPSYSSIVEISNNQQNRLGLVVNPMTIPEESSASIAISPFPNSSTDLVVSLTSSNTACISVIENAVVPGGQASIESNVQAVAGASDCTSVIEVSAEGYGKSRITLSVTGDAIPPQKPTTQEVDNIEGVTNHPRYPTTFQFDKPVKLLYLRTYHWNNGQGKSPGSLGLRHSDGTLYGLWQSLGLPGYGGVQNANWVVNPNIPLIPGVYTVVDSDPETWSTNDKAGWVGFATIRTEPLEVVTGTTSSTSSGSSQTTGVEYKVVIDNCNSSITSEGTNNTISVEFLNGNIVVEKISKTSIKECSSDAIFSIQSIENITGVNVTTTGDDGFYIDKIELYKGGKLAKRYGNDNGKGWCLSTDPGDANDSWKGTTENGCKASQFFMYPSSAQSYLLPPKTITITDISSVGKYTITATLNGNKYISKHQNGKYSEFEIKQFDEQRVHLIRTDPSGSTKGIGGAYIGKLTSKESAEGTAILTWKNWSEPLDVKWIINWEIQNQSFPPINPKSIGGAAQGTAMLLTASSNRDMVGRNKKLGGNGKTDAIFRAHFSAPNRTVSAVEVINTSGTFSVWDTRPNSRSWLGGVVVGARDMNQSDGSVNFSLGTGQNTLDFFVEDNGSIKGRKTNYRMTIFFDNGDPVVMDIMSSGSGS